MQERRGKYHCAVCDRASRHPFGGAAPGSSRGRGRAADRPSVVGQQQRDPPLRHRPGRRSRANDKLRADQGLFAPSRRPQPHANRHARECASSTSCACVVGGVVRVTSLEAEASSARQPSSYRPTSTDDLRTTSRFHCPKLHCPKRVLRSELLRLSGLQRHRREPR